MVSKVFSTEPSLAIQLYIHGEISNLHLAQTSSSHSPLGSTQQPPDYCYSSVTLQQNKIISGSTEVLCKPKTAGQVHAGPCFLPLLQSHSDITFGPAHNRKSSVSQLILSNLCRKKDLYLWNHSLKIPKNLCMFYTSRESFCSKTKKSDFHLQASL